MIALDELLTAGGRLHSAPCATTFADWSYDSRLTTPGACFIALRTARADGHDYIPAALAAGATGVLCRWPPADPGTATVVLSDDPQALLQRWAAARLAAIAPRVIGVTGSVGKTTTRRAIAAVLAVLAPTFQTRRSFNSLLGLPIALARLEARHRFAVLEYGSDRPGEIARLAALFRPHIAVITAVGETHLRGLGSLDGVVAEKSALVAALPPGGVAVLNGDDLRVRALTRDAPRAFFYGLTPGLDLWAEAPRYALDGTRLRLRRGAEGIEARVPLLGEPAVYAALAAVAVGLVCGMDLASCAAALARIDPPAGRLRPLPAASGAMLLDDSFSATAPSVRAALRTLAALPARRRIAILGTLSDLPPETAIAAARELGALAAHCADGLVLKGDWGVAAADAARAARPDLPISVVDTSIAAVNALPSNLGPGDLILVKGSAEARMERVVARLVEPAASLLLVRQEPAWRSVRVGAPDRPTWLRIDLDAIAGNVRRLCALAGVPLMAVLKGDGYGHGAARAARAALGAGAAAVAVATLGEGRALRQTGIGAPILVLGYLPPWQAEEAVALGLECTLFDADAAEAFHAAAMALGRPARVHVKVDTGMARLGLPPADTGPFLAWLRGLVGLEVTGIYTHFASADAPDLRQTGAQLNVFTGLLRELAAAGLRPPTAHAANSAALLRLPAARLDMARPGIACYGLSPGPAVSFPEGFRPALSFHSEVAQVRDYPPGTPISYAGAFVTARPSRIATIPVGYADGLRRTPPWREVLIRGRRAPIVGRICMDYAMVDVTDIPGVRRGDAVVLIGAQGEESISAEEVAAWLGAIPYEIVTGILPRVPREVGEEGRHEPGVQPA